MGERLHVDERMRLLAFLRRALPGWKRTTLEQRIRAGCVRVNGTTLAKNDFVSVGDEVEVVERALADLREPPPAGIVILHEDEELIAIDKPAGLLSVAAGGETARTAHALVRTWLSRPRAPGRLWPVHRLDRETSGVLLLAKSTEARDVLQANWSEVRKTYLALVDGCPSEDSGVIDEPLWEDDQLFVHAGRGKGSKEACTRWRVVASDARRALLEVEIDTGRRHQIRAHLAWLGHPIVGDARYGTHGGRMMLHALRLEFPHPVEVRTVACEAPAPREFRLG